MKIWYMLSLSIATIAVAQAQVKVMSDEKTNSLIIKAPIQIQKQIEQLVRDLDKENQVNSEIKVIQLVYLQAEELNPLLQSIMNSYKPVPIKSSQFGLNNNNWNSYLHGIVLADYRTNKIILISDKITNNNIEKVVKDLDKKQNQADSILISKIKNANSNLISEILNNVSGRRQINGNSN